MAPMFNSGWAKIDKYYQLSDSTPVYIAAIVLYPSRKWRYIDRTWNDEWKAPTRGIMREFWEKRYKPANKTANPIPTSSNLPESAKPKNDFF